MHSVTIQTSCPEFRRNQDIYINGHGGVSEMLSALGDCGFKIFYHSTLKGSACILGSI